MNVMETNQEIAIPPAPKLAPVLGTHIASYRKSDVMERTKLQTVIDIHQLYMQQVSRAHRHFLQSARMNCKVRQKSVVKMDCEMRQKSVVKMDDFGVKPVTVVPPYDAAEAITLTSLPDERALVVDGMRYDAEAMLHCAWGDPSAGFGPLFKKFDTSGRVSRLPGPPYQFITRVTEVNGKAGDMQRGMSLTVEYDIPASAWYFAENNGVMPYAVMMEAVLQPCGWLSVYMGIPLQTEEPLYVRNLDGTGTQFVDITPASGVLRTTVTLHNVSRANNTFLHSYHIESMIDNACVYKGASTFGHFPEASLHNQAGLAADDIIPGLRLSNEDVDVDLAWHAGDKLHLIDRILQYSPSGGVAGQGRIIAEKTVTPDAWFFKAHFYEDPVQPGSLGIEAMLHVLKWVMKKRGLEQSFTQPRFEAIRLHQPMTWKYRGHVVPSNRLIRIVVDLLEEGMDEAGAYVLADAMLTIDELPIYRANSIGMRIVESAEVVVQQTYDASYIRSYWAKEAGIEDWIVFDIYEALKQRFVGQINIMDRQMLKQYKKTPLLFVANHQTAVESPIFNYVMSALQHIPLVGLAKAEHQHTWIGKLMSLAANYPDVRLVHPMKFIERDNHMSALNVINDLGRSMQREHYSTLIHVEGTRSTYAGNPVQTISSTLIDLAIEDDLPLVPVRFTGGVPLTDEGKRYDFPYGFGKQDYWIGTPIVADDLAKYTIVERKNFVLAAINQLGPPVESKKPAPTSDLYFLQQVDHWHDHYGLAMTWAVIVQCLEELASKSKQTSQFLKYIRGDKLALSAMEQTWFQQLHDLMKDSDEAVSKEI